MNKLIIHGRLTRDPELKRVGDDKIPCCQFSVAVDRRGEGVDFFNCTAWRKLGEMIDEHFHKGKEILVEGRMEAHKYEKDGETRTWWGVQVESIDFCGKKSDSDGGSSASYTPPSSSAQADEEDIDEDDLPF
jgi:single-strand DNA-binding protein